MSLITLPKSKYDLLQKRASLYEAILRALPERKWGIEEYSDARIREFLREDRLDKKATARIKKILAK